MIHFLYTTIIYPLIQIIEFAFMLFNSIFKNEGISVIGVGFAVSILCLPLYIVAEHWQQIQRDTEKKLETGIKRIKETFKGDEQYMILTTFYRQNHYHPIMALRSSFGLLIQIPFFMAAYTFLSNLSILQGKSFLFIKDMGSPDLLFSIGNFPINVLPIAMTLINIIAGAIYTKGFKLKDKIQIYAMALLFLIILYNSPSGLVLYWTVNNIFSLVKNIFYKLKNSKKILYFLTVAAVIALNCYLLFIHGGFLHKRLLMIALASLLLFTPLVVKLIQKLLKTVLMPLVEDKKLRFNIFLLSSISLCILAGFLIPSFVVNSSVDEFANIDEYGNPLYFLYNSSLQMLGLIVFWPICTYLLFNEKVQSVLAIFMPALVFIALIDAFIFSGSYDTLSRLITFASPINKTPIYISLLNIVAILLVAALPILAIKFKKPKLLNVSFSIIIIASTALCIVHSVQISSSYAKYQENIASKMSEESSISPVYHLSKKEKNVVVFMLDRAESAYIEPIMNAYPEIRELYKGFTHYKNTVSYNGHTLIGSPPLFGGYDYTPIEQQKRKTIKLVDKQNESLLLLPRVFSEQADFTATVSDLSWANYSWIPDMTICDPYPKINGFNVQRKYSSLWLKENQDKLKLNITSNTIKRNLVWFSLFKFVPIFMRDSIYDDGIWWSSDETSGDIMEFIDYYSVLDFLPRLTDFTSEKNAYFTIVNDTTHSTQDLQAPEFEPSLKITDHGPEGIAYVPSIDGNIAALRKVGKWLEYLKENDCFDNTRIIMIGDHGIGTEAAFKMNYPENWPYKYNPDHLNPMLFVKDFNSSEDFKVSMDFMTTADVPYIALKDIIEKPVNPFTGNEIKSVSLEGKTAIVTTSDNWAPGQNGTNTFKIEENSWFTIKDNIFKAENWKQGINND